MGRIGQAAWITLLLLLALSPITAAAQSAISGQVRDDSGGVLPGVTVEAASPALIEGRRSVVTDGQGRYSIVELRPGMYSVTFTLSGFAKVVRTGVDLPSNFTATVDGTLKVGAIEETVTVTGASPVVDVQQAQRSQVLTSKLLESIVNSGSLWTQANLAAGVRISGSDVGGSNYGSDLQLESHGATSLHNNYTMEGLAVDNASGDGSDSINYYVAVSNQESVIETSGGTAEFALGGVRLNMIPRDGGNTFSGMAYAGQSEGAWLSNNFTERLKNLGVTAVNGVDRIWDYSAQEGGPILKDRMWFHFAARKWGNSLPALDSYYDDGRQYNSRGEIIGLVPRITWQATPRNKFVAHLERLGKYTGPKLACCATYPVRILPNQKGNDPETATTWKTGDRPYGAWYVKWSSPVTNRLLLTAGRSTSFILDGYPNQPGVDAPFGTPEWYSHVRYVDLDTGVNWSNAGPTIWRWVFNHEWNASASYVTGSHNIKVGVQDKDAEERRSVDVNGDIQAVQLRSGVPNSVIVTNYPIVTDPRLNHDVGVYAQDRWAIKRLSATYGLRVEWLNSGVPPTQVGAGRFVGARSFGEVKDVPNYGAGLSPRFGLAYDLFGNAKTAVKFSVGKYFTRVMTAYATALNPMAAVTATLPWSDKDILGRSLSTNGDGIPQDNELDLTRLPTNFGTRNLATLDPNFRREYNVETALSVHHELLTNVSVSAGWYHRAYSNMGVRGPRTDNLGDLTVGSAGLSALGYNQDWTADSYVPVSVVNPYNGEIFTAYNLKSASLLSQVHNLITNGKTNRQVYNGFEFSVDARLKNGGTILANATSQRTLTRTCDAARDDPNLLRFCDRFNLPAGFNIGFKTDFKIAASYPVAFGIQLSADFTSVPGRPEANIAAVDELLPINWLVTPTTRYTVADCTGRPCTAGALVIPNMVQSQLVLPLTPPGTARFFERQNQLNFSVRKIFRTRGVEWSPELDLFNALNADTVIAERSANYETAAFAVPSRILIGRLPRIALRINW
jgi:hypothetical protein